MYNIEWKILLKCNENNQRNKIQSVGEKDKREKRQKDVAMKRRKKEK